MVSESELRDDSLGQVVRLVVVGKLQLFKQQLSRILLRLPNFDSEQGFEQDDARRVDVAAEMASQRAAT